ncbi:uncharacterized protein LOC132699563 [Cylas formicarius]|uniref:uncharacterized protein LOC132699563 n=1 Tax=Cylas formicarius TaxID=197179 RepID=UPI002958B207|nr:uncharacterized protein LOC132699563 [Cylas formicarius]
MWLGVEIILFGVFSVGLGQQSPNTTQLSCFHCNPLNQSAACVNPISNFLGATNCTTLLAGNATAHCFSAYINYTSITYRSGVYRSCTNVSNYCNWLQQESIKENATFNCVMCNSSACNSHLINTSSVAYPPPQAPNPEPSQPPNSPGNTSRMYLSCYYCNPGSQKSQCARPSLNNVAIVNCASVAPSLYSNMTCYSAYVDYNNLPGRSSDTGIYRGCGVVPTYGSYCQWLNSYLSPARVISCNNCSSGTCNNHRFSSSGNITGGASSITVSVFGMLLIITMLFAS